MHIFTTCLTSVYNSSGNGHGSPHPGYMSWEQDVLAPLAGTNKLYANQVNINVS